MTATQTSAPLKVFAGEYVIHASTFALRGVSLADYCRSRCIDEGLSIDSEIEAALAEMERAEKCEHPLAPRSDEPLFI